MATETAPPTETATDAVPEPAAYYEQSIDSVMAEAMAALTAIDEEKAAPDDNDAEPKADAPSEPDATLEPAAPAVPATEDPLDSLRKRVEEGRAKRLEAQRAKEAEDRYSSTSKALEAKQRELEERVALYEKDPIAFLEKAGHDPRVVYQHLTKAATQPDQTRQDSALSQLEKKIADLNARLEQRDTEVKQQTQAQQQAAIHQRFAEMTGSEQFPHLALYEPHERLQIGMQVASEAHQNGVQLSDQEVAQIANARLQQRHTQLQQRLRASEAQPAAVQPKAGARAPSSPTTLTAELASETARHAAPMTDEERMEAAIKALRE